MTVPILFFPRKLGKRPAQCRKVKDGIVAEPALATRRLQNHPVHAIANNRCSLSLLHKRNYANKISCPFRQALTFQFRQQFRIPLCACGRGAGVARRFYSRSATEHWHNKSGIIRKYKSGMPSGIVQRLSQGVFGEGRCFFLKRGQGIEPRRRRQLDL